MAPDYKHIVKEIADSYPQDFKNCHRPELGEAAFIFIKRVAWKLYNIDPRFGLNGKRGTDELSMDAVSYRDGVVNEVYDVVVGAGGDDPRVGWSNVGGVSKWIMPEPMDGTPAKPTPTPGIDILELMTKLNGLENRVMVLDKKLETMVNNMILLSNTVGDKVGGLVNNIADVGERNETLHQLTQSAIVGQANAVIEALRKR